MTRDQLNILQDDHADLLLAITSAAKFGGTLLLHLDKVELGRVSRLLNLKSVKCGGLATLLHDRYELILSYSELNICLYTLVPKK